MVRIGGFRKTQNRIRLQRPRGRFISPYQTGGTIFGKSTTTRYPSMYSSSPALERWMKKHLQQRGKMKGGTIFGKSTRMRRQNPLRFPSMSQENDLMIERWLKQRMKGGTIFGKSTMALSVDAHVVSPIGSHGPKIFETTPPDERGHDF